jgi:hypothetical protein
MTGDRANAKLAATFAGAWGNARWRIAEVERLRSITPGCRLSLPDT